MASRIEIAQQFIDAQTSRDPEKIDAVAATLAAQAVMAGGRMGEVTGREAIVERLKNPPQMGMGGGMGGMGGGGGMGQLTWSDPVEDGEKVTTSATTPMGRLTRTFHFDGDEITRIEFARG